MKKIFVLGLFGALSSIVSYSDGQATLSLSVVVGHQGTREVSIPSGGCIDSSGYCNATNGLGHLK